MNSLDVDTSQLDKALKEIEMNTPYLLMIEGAGAKVLTNGMKMRVPVDTGATKLSIMSHLVEYGGTRVVDDIGPETDYAPDIEYGTSNPNYPVQPFVRPTAVQDYQKVITVIGTAFGELVKKKWPR